MKLISKLKVLFELHSRTVYYHIRIVMSCVLMISSVMCVLMRCPFLYPSALSPSDLKDHEKLLLDVQKSISDFQKIRQSTS